MRIPQIVTRHYNIHSSFQPELRIRSGLADARLDIARLWEGSDDFGMISYLLCNLYSDDVFMFWGRRHNQVIQIARTTMMVEAHWSRLKRVYLLPYNRPKCDFLEYILSVVVLPRFSADFELLCSGIEKPVWWIQHQVPRGTLSVNRIVYYVRFLSQTITLLIDCDGNVHVMVK